MPVIDFTTKVTVPESITEKLAVIQKQVLTQLYEEREKFCAQILGNGHKPGQLNITIKGDRTSPGRFQSIGDSFDNRHLAEYECPDCHATASFEFGFPLPKVNAVMSGSALTRTCQEVKEQHDTSRSNNS